MSCISMGSETPVLPVHALSIKLDGITPFIFPMLSESLLGQCLKRREVVQVVVSLNSRDEVLSAESRKIRGSQRT